MKRNLSNKVIVSLHWWRSNNNIPAVNEHYRIVWRFKSTQEWLQFPQGHGSLSKNVVQVQTCVGNGEGGKEDICHLVKGKGSNLLASEQRKVFADHVNALDVLRWVLQCAEEGMPLTSDKLKRLRASKFSELKLIEIVILWVYYTIPYGFSLFWHFWGITFHLFRYFVWLRITDEGSVPEMRIRSIL